MSDRDEFEKWAQPKGYLLEKLEDNRASYEFDDTHNAWEGWQAATKAQQARIDELEAMVKVKDVSATNQDPIGIVIYTETGKSDVISRELPCGTELYTYLPDAQKKIDVAVEAFSSIYANNKKVVILQDTIKKSEMLNIINSNNSAIEKALKAISYV